MKLPRGVRVADVAATTRRALRTFVELPATAEAVERWLASEYRWALVGEPRCPFVMPAPTTTQIVHAQATVKELREHATRASGDFIDELPTRVNIARVCDQVGGLAFAHVDVSHTPLHARVCALFLADYLTAPESYLLVSAS
ncbi:MAG TPA: hypothetical protein VH054_19970 [Polyangiaceae bacterium]|jgi:hypothetical protein|nr:hypothetical protein [Polyangiaceae bacterium]